MNNHTRDIDVPKHGSSDESPLRVGLAADHGGFNWKERLKKELRDRGHVVMDFGAEKLDPQDDYPDFVIPMAEATAGGQVDRGIAICGSGVGACVAANKVPGARAALILDAFSARQGVEDDDMNILCLGGRVIGYSLAWELIQIFLQARFTGRERYRRRLAKISDIEFHKDLKA